MKTQILVWFLFTAFIVLFVALASCSGGNAQRTLGSSGSASLGDSTEGARSIADIRAEIENLSTPAGVDEDVFAELKGKLIADFEAKAAGRLPAADPEPPVEYAMNVADAGEGSFTFSWPYRNIGDYDLSGETAIADITPIALYYLGIIGDATNDLVESFIDGDESGEVGISDITPIAENYLIAYEVTVGIFSLPPDVAWTREDFELNALSTVVAKLRPLSGLQTYIVIDLDTESATYGDASFTLGSDKLPVNPGNYIMVVRDAADPPGFIASGDFSIGVPGPPLVESVSPLAGGVGKEVRFGAVLTQGLPPFTYSWSFGGGATPDASEEAMPLVTLGAEGQYNGSVTVTNDEGSDTFDFTYDVMSMPLVNSVTPTVAYEWTETQFTADIAGIEPYIYEWYFGGGCDPNTSSEESPIVTPIAPGAYNAIVMVTNEYGSDTFDFLLMVLDREPSITGASPGSGTTGERVQLAATVSGLEPLIYNWTFNGAATVATSRNASPLITLASPGAYVIDLTVNNDYGSADFSFPFTVLEGTPDITNVTPTQGIAGTQYSPVATVTGMPPLLYAWDFGGGAGPNTSTEVNPTVTLTSTAGEYDASLTVTNALGQDVYPFTIVVQELPTPIEINSVIPTQGDSGQDITLIADVTGSYPRFYAWNFDTGATPNTSSQISPTVKLKDPGTYNASLTVSNPLGDVTYNFDLVVNPIAGQWTNEIVEWFGTTSTLPYIDMEMLPTGEPMISYKVGLVAPNEVLKTAVKRSGVWEYEVVDDAGGGQCGNNADLTLDPDGNPVIAYQFIRPVAEEFPYDLRVAWYNGASWDITTVDSDGLGDRQSGQNISISFGPSGKGFINHWFKLGQNDPFEIRAVLWDGSSWNGSTIGLNSFETIGILDSSENPLVFAVFLDEVHSFWYDGSMWQESVFLSGTGNNVSHLDLTLAPDGNPSVCWYDFGTGDLFFRHFNGTDWDAVETAASWNVVGTHNSIAYSPDGTPYISFFNSTRNWLQVTRRTTTGAWVVSTVDNGGRDDDWEGWYTSLRFAQDGKPRIAYFQTNQGSRAVKYATLH